MKPSTKVESESSRMGQQGESWKDRGGKIHPFDELEDDLMYRMNKDRLLYEDDLMSRIDLAEDKMLASLKEYEAALLSDDIDKQFEISERHKKDWKEYSDLYTIYLDRPVLVPVRFANERIN